MDDSKVDSVATAIMNAAHTGSKGDGKIFVSAVEESYDITTKRKGADVIAQATPLRGSLPKGF